MAETTKPHSLLVTADHKRTRSKTREGIKWDEETIAEHDKLRGTRQKINEPSTPYHYMMQPQADGNSDGDSVGGASAVAQNEADAEDSLRVVMKEVQARLPSDEQLSKERAARWDSEEGSQSSHHEDAFTAKRAAHYNEFQMMKQWREKHERLDEDSGEEVVPGQGGAK
ncbi:unnamed protein product [Chrysoparadoxa australica]